MKVLLLASYCEDCTNDLPCAECLRMCNVADIPDGTPITAIAGWDYMREKPYICTEKCLPCPQLEPREDDE